MAIGFTPKHIDNLPLKGLTKEQFIVIANLTVSKMGWKVGQISENGIICYTNNGIFSINSEIKIIIENDIANIQSSSTGNEMMDWGKNKKNVSNFKDIYNEELATFSNEELSVEYLKIKEQFVSPNDDILSITPSSTKEQIKDFFSFFNPRKDFFITPILLNLNILIFIVMAISGINIMLPSNESLLEWGANFKPVTLDGEWWRLITNCFLHIGILHLLMNMYALLYIGVLLEPYLGKIRFIAAYLLAGIIASLASLWWNDLTISAGASGAIFGMYGVFLALLSTNLIEKTIRKELISSIGVFVGFNLLNGLKDGIDNAAHIGGLLGGVIIGYSFIPSLKNTFDNNLKVKSIGLVSFTILALAFVFYKNLPNDFATYDTKIKKFVSMESMALEVYNLPPNTPKEKLLYEIKERGIYYWNENIQLLESFKALDLPVKIRTRNRLLKEYCEIRIKSYELLYKAISEKSDKYQSQIDDYNIQINAKIKALENL